MIEGAIASSFHFARVAFRIKTKARTAVRVHHLYAWQNLRFEAKQLAGVGHLRIPTRREMLALPAVDFF